MSESQSGSAEYRQNQLKKIVSDLHEGSDIKAVQKQFADLIRNVSPEEIAQLEQALITEGIPVEQVQKLCDIHVQVFEHALDRQKKAKVLPGHPVHTFVQENKALRKILKRIRPLFKRTSRPAQRDELKRELEELKKIEIHYQRKENQLFPFLEQVQFTGPSKVMWGKHDEIRSRLKELEAAINNEEWNQVATVGPGLVRAMRRMIFMEEKILYPTSMKKLSEQQWAQIRRGENEIGYAWVEPGNLWDPSVLIASNLAKNLGKREMQAQTAPEATDETSTHAGELPLEVGNLSLGQIDLMLRNLPIDITYVDAHDIVRYYSQGKERIFPRSPAVIGREVQNCHPPSSVHIVEKILESFRKKERDVAEFWLQLNERFIHIRYFALYDDAGDYKGVVEVSQDVTGIRSLKGQKRLLSGVT